MEQITLEINGKSVQAAKGATILQAAKAAGIKIPTLCDDDRLEPYGACRMCMVEIVKHGRPRLVASCLFPVQEGCLGFGCRAAIVVKIGIRDGTLFVVPLVGGKTENHQADQPEGTAAGSSTPR